MERRIIDKRKKEKFMVDDEYLNGMAKLCGWKGTIVYNSLCRHANIKQESFPSVKLMSVQHSVSRDTILRGIESLEKRKVIQIEKKRSKNTGRWLNNTYILLDKSEWDYSQVAVNDTDGVAVSDADQVAKEDTKEAQELKETHDLRKVLITNVINSDSKESQSKPETIINPFSVEETEIANEFDLPSEKTKIKPPRHLTASLQESDGAWLNKKIGLWLSVSPQNANLYKNKTERAKLSELYKSYPEKEVDFIVRMLPQTNENVDFFYNVFQPSNLLKHIDAWKIEFKKKMVKFKKQAKHVEFF